MADPSEVVSFLFQLMKFGGLVIAAIGVIVFILAKKNNNDDLSTNAIWIILGGVAAFGIGSFLDNQKLPTLG